MANLVFSSENRNWDWETLVSWGIYNAPEAIDRMYSIKRERGCGSYKGGILTAMSRWTVAWNSDDFYFLPRPAVRVALLVLWDWDTHCLSDDCILRIKLVRSEFSLLITKRACVYLCVKCFWLFICILKKSLPLFQKGVSFLRVWALSVFRILLSPGLNLRRCHWYSTVYSLYSVILPNCRLI